VYACFNARALGLDLAADATLDLAASANFSGVDLMVRDLVDEGHDPASLRARLDALGLRGGSWPLPVAWRGDAGRFQHDLARLPHYARAAATLGLTRTSTWVLPETAEPAAFAQAHETLRRAAFDFHVERLGAIARLLDDHGIRLGLEVLGVPSARTGCGVPLFTGYEDQTFQDLMRALQAQSPRMGLWLDTFHIHGAGESVEAIVRRWGISPVVGVHLADLPAGAPADRQAMRDQDRGLPGDHGAIDARRFLKVLNDFGYDGPVTAEPFAGCASLRGLRPAAKTCQVAARLRAVWPSKTDTDAPINDSTPWTGLRSSPHGPAGSPRGRLGHRAVLRSRPGSGCDRS
jgi:sugar phosphate isomerase/epimerase